MDSRVRSSARHWRPLSQAESVEQRRRMSSAKSSAVRMVARSTSKKERCFQELHDEHGYQESPFDKASIWSRFTYLYALPLFRLGAQRPLLETDLPPLARRDTVARIAARIEAAWMVRQGKGPGALARALLAAFKSEMLWSGWYFAVDFGAIIAQAALLRPFVNWLARKQNARILDGVMWMALLLIMGVLNIVYHHYSFFMLMRCGWNVRAGMTRMLHDKLLRVRHADVAARISSGKVYSLVAADAQRFDNLLPFFHTPWFAVVAVVCVFVLMARIVGAAAAAAGCGVVVASVLIQVRLAFRFRHLRRQTAQHTDRRVRLVGELLAGVVTIKASGWTADFLRRVDDLRLAETATILRSQYCKAITSGLYVCTVVVATFAVYAVVYVGNLGLPASGLHVGDVASLVALLNALRQIISFGLAMFLMAFPEVLVALERMQEFLLLPETPTVGPPRAAANDSDNGVLLHCVNATFAWPVATRGSTDVPQKDDIGALLEQGDRRRSYAVAGANLDVFIGQVVAVAGPVASGKSSLLLGSALNELNILSGCVERGKACHVAYCAQQPWLFAGTLRANVAAPDEATFDKALHCSDLEIDLQSLPGGKEARLGDRGISLSGGQRARLSLARAIASAFATSEQVLVVLDDPTAALDAKVANAVIDRSFRSLLETGRVGILVATHSEPLLRRADLVVVLGADGRIIASGTYNELVDSGNQRVSAELFGDAQRRVKDEEPALTDIPKETGTTDPTKTITTASAKSGDDGQNKPIVLLLEERETGSVSTKTWVAYTRAAGTGVVAFVVVIFVIGQGLLIASDAYLLAWSTVSRRSQRRPRRLAIFACLAIATVTFSLVRAACFYWCAMRAATSLHRNALAGVLRTPLWWHSGTPRGRVLNRFSSDVYHNPVSVIRAVFFDHDHR